MYSLSAHRNPQNPSGSLKGIKSADFMINAGQCDTHQKYYWWFSDSVGKYIFFEYLETVIGSSWYLLFLNLLVLEISRRRVSSNSNNQSQESQNSRAVKLRYNTVSCQSEQHWPIVNICELMYAEQCAFIRVCCAALRDSMCSSWSRYIWLASHVFEEACGYHHPPLLGAVVW